MPLTWSEFVALLTPNPENDILTVNGTAFDTPAVAQLFAPCFIDGNLVVVTETWEADEGAQVVEMTGALAPLTFLGISAGALTEGKFTLLPDGTVAVRLVVRVDDEFWTPSKSFEQLLRSVFDEMLWSQAELTLDSTAPDVLPADFGLTFGYPPNLPEVAERMIKGLSLRATVDFRGYLDALLSMFAPPVAVQGPIELYLQNDLDEDGNPLPAKKTMPQLRLLPESDVGLTREVGEYTFKFTLELASLFQQFPTGFGKMVTILPTPAVASRTDMIVDTRPEPLTIPISLIVYNTTGGKLMFNVGQPVNQPIQKQDVSQLLNGVGVGTLLEPGNGFPIYEFLIVEGVSVTLLSGVEALAINGMQLAASIGAGKQWVILDGLLTIDAIIFVAGINRNEASFTPYASISARAFLLGNEEVILSAAVALPDLTFFVQLDIREDIDLTALVKGLIGDAIPLPLITGATFAISGDIRGNAYAFESEIVQEWVLFGSAEKGLVLKKIGLSLSTLAGAVSGGVYGVLSLAGAELILSASYEPGGWTFTGGTTPGQRIDLVALFADLFALFDVELPPGLPIVYLTQLRVSYTTETGVFEIAAAVAVPAATYNLADLPLIGEWLDPSNRISLEYITFTVHTGKTTPPAAPIPTYVEFGFRVGFGTNDSVEVVIPIYGKRPPAAPPTTPPTGPSTALVPPPEPPKVTYPAEGSGTWVPAQRFFGPLAVEKLGFILDDRGIGVQFNASLNVSNVLIEALGLKMLVPVDEPFIPSFGLDGLAVTFKTPVLTIGGGLVRVPNPDFMQFDGALVVQAKKFGISAFGSYATSEPPSMFVFALLNVPIGGPPFFFISGFSGGFGFNRDLLMPQLWEIPRFPLVAGASPSTNPFGFEPTIGDFLAIMDDYMGVSIGQYWVAAGVEVTSFNVLKSQILLTLAFGTRFQVAILGLSTLSIPPGAAQPVARAQLALEAVFVPDDGVLSIAAQLTPGSYVFAPECFLTGGFAFYLWFSPSPFAGDFVVSLGGYNPYFTRPAHYPSVPLLGMNWFLANSPMVFKGGVYIALTPHAVMAGGFMLATWTTTGIKVSFSLTADFLINWKPFHYEIKAGVSFNVNASINVKVARITLSVTVGAELHVWGPPFSGQAYINLSVISFTIAFGDAEDVLPSPIDWSEFKRTFFPPPMSPVSPAMRVTEGATATDSIVKALFASGLQMDLRDKPDVPVDYTVDPQLLELYVQTLMPAKSVSINGRPLQTHNEGFGIGPMSVAVEKLASELAIEIVRNGVAYDGIDATAVIERAPKALWLHDPAPQQTLNNAALIDDVAQGITVKPGPDAPSHSLPIEIEILLYSPEGSDGMEWGSDEAPATNPYGGADPWTTLTGTIADPEVDELRANLIANLIYAGTQVSPDIDVAPLTNPDTLNLLDPVVLAPLGYEGAAA